jgi:micrococcal nuclease
MYHYKVKRILKVVDGDTVDVEIDLGFGISVSHRIRLKNINAPEVHTSD